MLQASPPKQERSLVRIGRFLNGLLLEQSFQLQPLIKPAKPTHAAKYRNFFIDTSSHANHVDIVEINDLISGVETYNTFDDVQVQRVYFLHHFRNVRRIDQKISLVRRNACALSLAQSFCSDRADWPPLFEFKMTNTISKQHEWLPLLATLFASVLLVTVVGGQEADLQLLDLNSAPRQYSELTSPLSVEQPEPISVGCSSDIGPSGKQVLITSKSCFRKAPVCVCQNDEIWLISARDSHCAPSDLSLLECSRLENGHWKTAELNDLVHQHTSDKTKVTMIYVHGNRTALKWAVSRGLQFYKHALQTEKRPPMRFVLFAWKSEMEKVRVMVDYDIKSQRSVTIGETFGNLLGRFEDRQLVLGGFSLGAQVVLTALSKPELQIVDGRCGKYRVALMAPALNAQFVQSDLSAYPQHPLVYQTDVFLNCDDHAVKVSEKIVRRQTQSRFTLQDLNCQGGMGCNSIKICNISREVKHRHSIINYGRSATMNIKLANLLNATFEECNLNPLMPRDSNDADFTEPDNAETDSAVPNLNNAAIPLHE